MHLFAIGFRACGFKMREIIAILENQVDNTMENHMETGLYTGVYRD